MAVFLLAALSLMGISTKILCNYTYNIHIVCETCCGQLHKAMLLGRHEHIY